MKLYRIAFCLIIVIFCTPHQALSEDKLYVGYGYYQSPPFVIFKDRVLVGGIMQLIANRLSSQLNMPYQMVEVPRKRLSEQLQSGMIDVRCHLSPVWMKHAEDFFWSKPLYQLETRVVAKSEKAKRIKIISDVSGNKVGIVHGFFYAKSLTRLFKSGLATSVQAKSVKSLLRMMDRDRMDIVIGNKTHLDYLLKTTKLVHAYQIAPLVIRRQNIHCAVSKKHPQRAAAILKAIETMHLAGEFKGLIKQ